jgi:hypothetical protein
MKSVKQKAWPNSDANGISPDYKSDALSLIRPALNVEGEQDPVNAKIKLWRHNQPRGSRLMK